MVAPQPPRCSSSVRDVQQRAFDCLPDEKRVAELEELLLLLVGAVTPDATTLMRLLCAAIAGGTVESVAVIIAARPRPLSRTLFNEYAGHGGGDARRLRLMHALCCGLPDMQQLLAVTAGARSTVLADAASLGCTRAACFLVSKRGAQVDFQDMYGNTALEYALEAGPRGEDVADALVIRCRASIKFPVLKSLDAYYVMHLHRFPSNSVEQHSAATLHLHTALLKLQERVEQKRFADVFSRSKLGGAEVVRFFG